MKNNTPKLRRVGGDSGWETPGPIPNPEAKPTNADGTAPGRMWESRTPPTTNIKDRPTNTSSRAGLLLCAQTRTQTCAPAPASSSLSPFIASSGTCLTHGMCSTESEFFVHQCLPVLGLLCSPVTDVTANRRYEFSDSASQNVTVTQQFFSV